MLEEIEAIKIKDHEKYVLLFKELINQVKRNEINKTFFEEQKCKLIRFNTKEEEIVYLVPNPLLGLFNKLRKKYIKVGKEFGYSVEAVVLPRLNMKEAVSRRKKNPHGQPDKKLWEEVWIHFDKIYKDPTHEEGFDSILKLKGVSNDNKILP